MILLAHIFLLLAHIFLLIDHIFQSRAGAMPTSKDLKQAQDVQLRNVVHEWRESVLEAAQPARTCVDLSRHVLDYSVRPQYQDARLPIVLHEWRARVEGFQIAQTISKLKLKFGS